MASAAEQLARNINFGAFSKATELKKRIWFTLGALVIYRLGTYIPLPGINPAALEALMSQQSGGIIGMFDMFSGGALRRMTILALNIMPYITASIIMQLMSSILPSLEAIKKEGPAGAKKINQYTRMLTVGIAAAQAFAIANGLAATRGSAGAIVLSSGPIFYLTTVISLTCGTVFLMWLGEQITQRGVGNGTSLIIFSGIVARLPTALTGTLELGRTGALELWVIILLAVVVAAVIGFIVFFERAQRRIIIQYPKRQVGNKMFGGEASHLPLKLNSSGVIPPIFASSLLLLPTSIAGFGAGANSQLAQYFSLYLGQGRPVHTILYIGLIVFFAFFYTAIVVNPVDLADNLKKYGGFIPGIRPGKNTADYLDYVLTRLTVLGAGYLAIVCVLPEILLAWRQLPFYFGGTSLLIVVSVTMDTVAQVHSHLLAHQYEGLIKKSKLKGRR
jgi:preprotein translocase subunit SecY